MAFKGQCRVPGTLDKGELYHSGLGLRTIAFAENGDSEQFHAEVLNTFPKLKDAGGYILMRTTEEKSRDLVPIPAPPSGYSVEYLRNMVIHAKIYISPLQKDLPLDTVGECNSDFEVPTLYCVHDI